MSSHFPFKVKLNLPWYVYLARRDASIFFFNFNQFQMLTFSITYHIKIPTKDNLYCKFSFQAGPDWTVLTGLEEGISQLSKGMEPGFFTTDLEATPCVWNFPVSISFKSTNVYGWPIILVTVYGFDFWGRDVVRGYGSLRLPLAAGRYTEYIPLFAPVATTPFNAFYGWALGRLPEFLDPKFAAKEEGREMTRVASNGSVKVCFTVITKEIEACGYIGESHK